MGRALMARMDLAAIMDKLAEAAKDGAGVERAYGWPNSNVNPPCVIVGYPTDAQIGITAGRSNDRLVVPVWLYLGKVDDRATRDTVAAYLTGEAEQDIIDALNASDQPEGGPIMSARVNAMTWEPANPQGIAEYLTIRFDVDVLT